MEATRIGLDPQDAVQAQRRIVALVRAEGYGPIICDRMLFDAAPLELRREATRHVVQERLGGAWAWDELNGIQGAHHPLLGFFVFLPGFETQIGSPESEEGRYDDEGPMYRIYVMPMFMAAHNVTELVWNAVGGGLGGSQLPKTMVSWLDCQEWLKKASVVAGVTLTLPWEEEWEGACRAGSTTPYFWGESAADADRYCWHSGNSGGRVHEVGQLAPNPWGLYDIVGNVWEWCRDEWTPDHSEKAKTAARFSKLRREVARAKFALNSRAITVEPNALAAKERALPREECGQAVEHHLDTGCLRTEAAYESQSTSNAEAASRWAPLPDQAARADLHHGGIKGSSMEGLMMGLTQTPSAQQSTSNALVASRLAPSSEEAQAGVNQDSGALRFDPKSIRGKTTATLSESESTSNAEAASRWAPQQKDTGIAMGCRRDSDSKEASWLGQRMGFVPQSTSNAQSASRWALLTDQAARADLHHGGEKSTSSTGLTPTPSESQSTSNALVAKEWAPQQKDTRIPMGSLRYLDSTDSSLAEQRMGFDPQSTSNALEAKEEALPSRQARGALEEKKSGQHAGLNSNSLRSETHPSAPQSTSNALVAKEEALTSEGYRYGPMQGLCSSTQDACCESNGLSTVASPMSDSASQSTSNALAASRYCLSHSVQDSEITLDAVKYEDIQRDQSTRLTLDSASQSTSNSKDASVPCFVPIRGGINPVVGVEASRSPARVISLIVARAQLSRYYEDEGLRPVIRL